MPAPSLSLVSQGLRLACAFLCMGLGCGMLCARRTLCAVEPFRIALNCFNPLPPRSSAPAVSVPPNILPPNILPVCTHNSTALLDQAVALIQEA